jgi:hypothetical protein
VSGSVIMYFMTAEEAVEEIQADLTDLSVSDIAAHLSSAECCESAEDLAANLAEIEAAAKALAKRVAGMRLKLARATPDEDRDDAEELGHSN